MDGLLGLYLVLIFIALIAFGVPIAISIGVSSIAILAMNMPFEVSVSTAGQKMVNGIDSFSLLAAIKNERFFSLIACSPTHANTPTTVAATDAQSAIVSVLPSASMIS